jgi:5-amino-6-(5-phosphoribosylamino)uracil reductase
MSVDGYIDHAGPDRLILSSDADLDRVDEVRAGCDAILVGAGTIRNDDPRLVVRSAERRARRLARGAAEDPAKVTITATGNLDPAARFFTTGSAAKLVYCARPALATARARLSGVAEVIDAGDSPSPVLVLCDLAERGVASVLLEGGGQLAAEFLASDLADELHLVVAPFFIGDLAAPRFAVPGGYPHGPANRMKLAEVRELGDVVLLRYLLGTRPDPRPPAEEASQPARGSDSAEATAAPAPGPSGVPDPAVPDPAVPDPGGSPAAHVPRPAPSPELPSPRADDIRWLRETIALLSAEDPGPPPPHDQEPHPHDQESRPSQAYGNQGAGGGQPRYEPPSRDQRSDERPSRDQRASERPYGEQPYSERSPRDQRSGEQPYDDLSSRRQNGAQEPYGERPYGEQPYGEQSYGEQSSRVQRAAERPYGEQSYGGRSSRDQRAGERPYGEQAAATDRYWLRETIELSKRCPPSQTAFSVGAIIVGANGAPLASGFSREADPRDHAEEAALGKLRPGDPRLTGATIYSSLEPCGVRASRPHPCAELIIAAGLRRVVYAWREPPLLATGGGADILRAAGVSVTEVPELAAEARQVNAHLTNPTRHPSS